MKIFFKGLFYTLSVLAFYVIALTIFNLLNYYNIVIIKEETIRAFISFVFTVFFVFIEIFLKVQESERSDKNEYI